MRDGWTDESDPPPCQTREVDLVVRVAVGRLLLRLAISVGFLATSVLLFARTIDWGVEGLILAYGVCPIGAVMLLDTLRRSVGGVPTLVANPHGILRERLLFDYVIPWSEVKDIIIHRSTLHHGLMRSTSENLVILVRDPARITQGEPLLTRMVHSFEFTVLRLVSPSPVTLGAVDIDRPLDLLREELLALRARMEAEAPRPDPWIGGQSASHMLRTGLVVLCGGLILVSIVQAWLVGQRRGRWERDASLIIQLLDDGKNDEAIRVCSEEIEHGRLAASDLAQAYVHRGYAYTSKGEYGMAISDCTRAMELDPGHAIAHSFRGFAFNRTAAYEKAITDYTEAIDLGDRSAATYSNRGLAYLNAGDYDRAISDCSSAIELDTRMAAAYSNRGRALLEKGKSDEAIADCTKAIALNPRSSAAYNNRGLAHHKKREYDLAIGDYGKAIGLEPGNAMSYSNRGCSHVDKGEYDQAILDCTKAIELDPGLALAYSNRGAAFSGKRVYDRAMEDYTKAIDLGPPSALRFCNRGVAHACRGEYDLAITDYGKAMELAPADPVNYEKRAEAFEKAGDLDRAGEDRQKAEELRRGR